MKTFQKHTVTCEFIILRGARVAQWVRSLVLTTHTRLSPIRRGFAPSFVIYKKGSTRLAAASDKAYQLLAQGRWFSLASSIAKIGRHDIAEILLKVALNTKIQIQIQIHYSSLIVLNHKIVNSTNICSNTYVHIIAEDSPIYSNGQTCQNQTLQPTV